MSAGTTIKLINIDPDEIDDVLVKIEKSFGFRFGKAELKDVKTFGKLCDIITAKVQGNDANDCTTQQAFYKLRKAIACMQRIDEKSITPYAALQEFFPRRHRRQRIKELESELGFKTNILRPKRWITGTLVLLLFASFITLFIFWQAGLAGLLLCTSGFRIADKFATEFNLQTLEQFAAKISRENYRKARRNPGSVNREEITKVITELFSTGLDLDQSLLTREAAFN